MTIKKTRTALVIPMVIAALMAVSGPHFNARGDGGGGASAPQLEGSWEITVMPDGGAPIVDIATFTSNGGLINSDPDPNLSTGHGTWVRTGGREFAVTFVHFLRDQGTALGTVKVRSVIRLDRHSDTFRGPFRTDVIIGGNVVQSFCGTVQARRINVEPIETCP